MHVLSGKDAVFFPASRDYKRLGTGNTGPNTGGMGAITSAEFGRFWMDGIRERIANPVLLALRERGSPFVGCFYPGIMLTRNGPMALDLNA
ncbi:phosphoribosylamine--glycine ligase, partial [Candidatus Azambacteria bacterium]|nr:phosphoribosylamine--glycine ligase [Candidatus Azambacteria bacterium]